MLKKLGKKLPNKPKGKFPLESQDAILNLAATVENLGAAAYLGQAPLIKDKEVLAAALSIHSVEARHAAVVSLLLGRPISPDGAFARPAASVDVTQSIRPYITA